MGSRSQHCPTNHVAGTSPEKRREGSSPSREAKLSPVVFKGLGSLHPALSSEESRRYSQVGQGGDICEDALREAGNVIAMERPAENRRSCNAQGSKVGSKDCGPPTQVQLWVAEPHHIVTVANAPSAPRADEPSCAAPAASTLPTCMHPAPSGHRGRRDMGSSREGAEQGCEQGLGQYLQQPQGTQALEGQRRDALQGVVAEDPAEGKQPAQPCVCCKKPTLGSHCPA